MHGGTATRSGKNQASSSLTAPEVSISSAPCTVAAAARMAVWRAAAPVVMADDAEGDLEDDADWGLATRCCCCGATAVVAAAARVGAAACSISLPAGPGGCGGAGRCCPCSFFTLGMM